METPEYSETVRSPVTSGLFTSLTLLFAMLLLWRLETNGPDGWAITWLSLALFFLFYALNYRSLHIQLNQNGLALRFGIFRWRVPYDNIAAFGLDPTSLWRIGGAGIHFTFIEASYRVMFNFLQYPRVLLGLRYKQGPVSAVVFTTRHPEEVLSLLRAHTQLAEPGR